MTQRYQNILYATDLHDKDLSAAQQAQDLATAFGGRLSLLHMVRPLISTYAYVGEYEIEQQIVAEAKEQMTKLGNQIDVAPEDQYVIEGFPKEDIIKFAEENKVDLLVLNGHKHYLLGVLGSTASAIINKASCDVFILSAGKK